MSRSPDQVEVLQCASVPDRRQLSHSGDYGGRPSHRCQRQSEVLSRAQRGGVRPAGVCRCSPAASVAWRNARPVVRQVPNQDDGQCTPAAPSGAIVSQAQYDQSVQQISAFGNGGLRKQTGALQCEAEPRDPRRQDPIPTGHNGYECVVMEIGRPDRQLCGSWLGLLRQSSSPYGLYSRRQTPWGLGTKSGNLVA